MPGAGYDAKASAAVLAANQHTAWLFACSFAATIGIFAIAHFSRLYLHLQIGSRGTLGKLVVAPFRVYRRLFLRKLPRFTSGGHMLLILVYYGLNALLVFWDMEFEGATPYSFFAKRCGWMSVCNAALAFLLSMKNTPLAFLTGYSHERLNVLHRWVGRTIWFFSCLHVLTFCITMRLQSAEYIKEELTQLSQVYGLVAFTTLNILFATSLHFIRRRFYEFFYIIHVCGFVIAVTFMGLHKPKKFAKAMYAMGSFWIFDRVVRIARATYYNYGNSALVIPLPGLATKVVFKRSINYQPGSHAFISIPEIRSFQSHPFTISSTGAVEFVIRAQQGFTLDLYKFALKHPHQKVRAFIDGPYGAVPDFKNVNNVVLIAGGSGAAFLFPIAIDIVRNASRCRVTEVQCVWVIRDERSLVWYEDEIEELQKSPLAKLSIYVTSKADPIVSGQPAEVEADNEENVRRSLYVETESTLNIKQNQSASSSDEALQKELGITPERVADLEKQISRDLKRRSQTLEKNIDEKHSIKIDTLPGRPDLTSTIKSVVAMAETRDTVGVGACGPAELMRVARNAVAESITIAGPSVTLHCEQFGWG